VRGGGGGGSSSSNSKPQASGSRHRIAAAGIERVAHLASGCESIERVRVLQNKFP
jgi:hypothetical protein